MAPNAIEARGLTKHYGSTVGIEQLDLRVEPGEIFGLLGPNGAGKTTTIRLLLDLIRPTRGTVELFGRPPGDPAARRRVGYLPGDLVLDPRLSGRRTLDFLGSLSGQDAASASSARRTKICRRLGLVDEDLARPVREYSRGMRQKLGLVAALQHDPELLVLDEPTSALDPLVRETVFELLLEAGRAGRTVFHCSHVLSEVERVSTRIGIVKRGRLAALGRVDEIRRRGSRRMVLRFAEPVSRHELTLPGVEVLEADGRAWVLRVSGMLDPLLAVLARHRVEYLSFPEPSLEEAFVELYRDDDEGPS